MLFVIFSNFCLLTMFFVQFSFFFYNLVNLNLFQLVAKATSKFFV